METGFALGIDLFAIIAVVLLARSNNSFKLNPLRGLA